MTREELGQAVSQAVASHLNYAVGFPLEAPLDPVHTIFANFLVLRYYHAACLVHDKLPPEKHPLYYQILGKGMRWVVQVERLPWSEAAFFFRSLQGAGLRLVPDFPSAQAEQALASPEAYGRFWEEYGHLVILNAIFKRDERALELIERPLYVLTPSGWVSTGWVADYLELRTHKPGRRPKAAIRLALDVLKVAPPRGKWDLVDLAVTFLSTLRSTSFEP